MTTPSPEKEAWRWNEAQEAVALFVELFTDDEATIDRVVETVMDALARERERL